MLAHPKTIPIFAVLNILTRRRDVRQPIAVGIFYAYRLTI